MPYRASNSSRVSGSSGPDALIRNSSDARSSLGDVGVEQHADDGGLHARAGDAVRLHRVHQPVDGEPLAACTIRLPL